MADFGTQCKKVSAKTGVDKTRNRTRTGGRGPGLADADMRTEKQYRKIFQNNYISKDDAPTSFPFLKYQILEHTA